jgi:DNA primase large subunit
MKDEKIICYVGYVQKGISLYKVNDSDYNGYITIDRSALIRMIEDNAEGKDDMDLTVLINYHYGKFSDEQLKTILMRIKEIIRTNEKYKAYRNIKEIELI